MDDGETDPAAYLTFVTRRALAERTLAEAGHGAWWGAFLDDRLASVMGLVDAGGGLARYQSVETHPDFGAAAWRARWCTGWRRTASTIWARRPW